MFPSPALVAFPRASRRLTALMATSALGSLAVLSAAPARAADECGVAASGVPVVCTAAGGPYDRVVYNTPFSLNLQLQEGAVFNGGLDLQSGGGAITVSGADVDLAASGGSTLHIWRSPIADVHVSLRDVTHTSSAGEAVFINDVRSAVVRVRNVTSGRSGVVVYAQGAAALEFERVVVSGPTDIDEEFAVTIGGNRARLIGGSIVSTGLGGLGVTGNYIDVEVDSVRASGEIAVGVKSNSSVQARLTIDDIVTAGVNSEGLRLSGSGEVTLALGAIETSGDFSTGVLTDDQADFSLISGDIRSVTTSGAGSMGLYLYADNITLTGGSISTTGVDATGAYLSANDSVNFNFDTVTTTGDDSSGVAGYAAEAFTLAVGRISTAGDNAEGVVLLGDRDLTVDVGEVVTQGRGSTAVEVESQLDGGVLLIDAGTIRTAGDDSTGVHVGANGSRTTVNVGNVTTGQVTPDGTTGADAHGVSIVAAVEATVNASSIETRGASADAITVNSLPLGDVTVNAGTLTTHGDGSRGVFLDMTEPGDFSVHAAAIVTSGAQAHGVLISNGGGGEILVSESITTRGDDAFGIRAELRDETRVEALQVSTQGAGATAVHLEGNSLLTLGLGALTTIGDQAHGADLRALRITGAVDGITTSGAGAFGVRAVASDGLGIAIGRVRTGGAGAVGVSLTASSEGVAVEASDVATTGDQAHGVVLDAAGDITADIGRVVVRGQGAGGLIATTDFDQTVTVAQGVTAQHGAAVDLTGRTVDFTLGQGGVVRGGEAGVRIDASQGSHVILNGSVSASHGLALNIKGGATVIDNLANTIEGHIDLTDNDDVLNNAGRFTAGGLSDFGLGSDVLNNTGLINLFEATTPRTATFVGLERLNNAGTIDLANGVAGDIFTIDGVLNGQAGNSIELDLDLRGATPLADHVAVGGFEGLSHILLSVQGRAALGETGVVIARSNTAQTGEEVDVAVAGGGFVDFDLVFADGAFRLVGDLAAPAFEPTKVASGAQHQWTSGADVVSARFDQMRDAGDRPEGRGDQVWAQVYGGSNDIEAKRGFDLFGETLDADLSHEVKSQGVQAGVDRAVPIENGSLVFGMLAGAGKTELRFQNGDVTEYDGVGVGAYGHWFSGPLSIGVLAKLDTFKLDYDWAEANLKTRSDGFTVGARVDAAWRIQAGQGWYVEPQASLSWSDTALGRMKARDGAEVVFGDTTSMVGRIGVRAGAEMTVGNGLNLKPFAAVHALNEFEGDNASTLILGDEAVGVADRAHGAWGRAVLGAGLDAPSGLGGFIQVEGDFGEVEGFTARAGVKFNW